MNANIDLCMGPSSECTAEMVYCCRCCKVTYSFIQNLGVSDASTQVCPQSSDAKIQHHPARRRIGNNGNIPLTTNEYYSQVQTHRTATKDNAVQCSLLSAPPLSFLNKSSASAEEDDNEDEKSNTDTSESESGEETDVSYSEVGEYDDHLERYEAHYIF